MERDLVRLVQFHRIPSHHEKIPRRRQRDFMRRLESVQLRFRLGRSKIHPFSIGTKHDDVPFKKWPWSGKAVKRERPLCPRICSGSRWTDESTHELHKTAPRIRVQRGYLTRWPPSRGVPSARSRRAKGCAFADARNNFRAIDVRFHVYLPLPHSQGASLLLSG
jgi:hypothetical protein